MKIKFVIDSSVFLAYASYGKIYRLASAVFMYHLSVYINEELIDELLRNAPKVIQVSGISPQDIVSDIMGFATYVQVQKIFTQSPDPKDNFLFDLALQTDSEVIVTQEKALLGFTNSPVAIHDLKWFKENYPVPL